MYIFLIFRVKLVWTDWSFTTLWGFTWSHLNIPSNIQGISMNNINIKRGRLRVTYKIWAQRSIKHVCVPWSVGIGNSKLEGECTCVARRPKNVPATSGLNELLTTTWDAHTCSSVKSEVPTYCWPSTEHSSCITIHECSLQKQWMLNKLW